MTALRFDCVDLVFELPSLRGPYDVEVGVVATLTVTVQDRLVYREVQFPVVELRLALGRWSCGPEVDFEFESMASDETGLIWLRRQPSGLWRVGSVHQDRPEMAELERPVIIDAIDRLAEVVDAWVYLRLGVTVGMLDGST